MNDEIRDLFRKYAQGAITRGEIAALRGYVNLMDDSALEAYLSDIWDDYRSPISRNEAAYEKILHRLRRLKRPPVRKMAGAAAFWRSVAAVMVLASLALSGYVYQIRKAESAKDRMEYVTSSPRGGHATVMLPDSTFVYLNGGSTIKYSSAFGVKNRDVELSGEAYFEVSNNKDLPFAVRTIKADVVVTGTTFNVYAYPSSPLFEVALASGSLEVVMPNGATPTRVPIAPKQKVRYDSSTGEYEVLPTDLYLETAWKRGDLVFRSESMASVLEKLEDFYAVKIHVSGKIPQDLYTGTYHEEEIAPVLRNMQIHYRFSYTKSGNDVYISFKGE